MRTEDGIAVVGIIALALALPIYAQTSAKINAVVVDKSGTATTVAEIGFRKRVHGSTNFWRNVEADHSFVWDYIPINTGGFIAYVPLGAVRTITIAPEAKTAPKESNGYQPDDKYYRVTILLLDGQTKLSGEFVNVTSLGGSGPYLFELGGFGEDDSFVGTTAFGAFSINVSDVREISFSSRESSAPSWGSSITSSLAPSKDCCR